MAFDDLPTMIFLAVSLLFICRVQSDTGQIESVEKQAEDLAVSKNLDLVFLIHTSTKVNKKSYSYYKEFMRDIVQDANVDSDNVRVALVVYKMKALVVFNLKKYKTKQTLIEAINNLKIYRAKDGNVAAGLDMVRTKVLTEKAGDRLKDAPNVVIVLTDANSKTDMKKVQSSAKALRDAGSKVYAVGVNIEDGSQIQQIATSLKDAYSVATFSRLPAVKNEVVKQVAALQQNDEARDETALSVENSRKIDLAIVYHLSNQIKPQEIDKYFVPFLVAILEKAKIDNGDVRVALINYAKRARTAFDLDKFKTTADIVQELSKIDRTQRARVSSGGSALTEVRTKIFDTKAGDRPDVPNAVILITDAKNAEDQETFLHEANTLKAAGAKIITVGVASANSAELKTVASHPADKNAIFSKSYSSIASLDVIDHIRNAIGALQDSRIRVTPATTPAAVIGCADARIDLVFVLDASTSVTEPNFELMKEFVKDFLFEADIDGGNVRVGVIIYSTEDYVQFHLNRYQSKADVYNAIDAIPYRHGSTNTADALQTMRTEMFTLANGDRPNVDNIAIVVTDGVSNINSRRTIPEAEQARAGGIHIYAIGIGLTDTKELDGIASKPVEENRFAVQEFKELRGLRNKVFSSLCSSSAPVTRVIITEPPSTRPPSVPVSE